MCKSVTIFRAGQRPGGNEMEKKNEYDLAELLEGIINYESVLHGLSAEADDSMPELTIRLDNGQVFNLCVKRVK